LERGNKGDGSVWSPWKYAEPKASEGTDAHGVCRFESMEVCAALGECAEPKPWSVRMSKECAEPKPWKCAQSMESVQEPKPWSLRMSMECAEPKPW